ncbi:hypothetical protein AbraIFM66951_006547 [Aspergillus brasiliensis]|uniref:Thioredoxin n=1 Tax=Aspergillus brasiliensis TaxID=319629 RepID=A0A9W5YJZ6_9EURO|nr:hypothetical protein AbraCBS73388_011510 [Aspergillus brasiliensis]GKZ44386.1 hypothetical protein AbraIFM66951_006547 [Aspergillus brasiliensis]
MPVTPVESLSDFQALISSNDVVVVDFWATWCGPCKAMSPVFEKMASSPEFSAIKFAKVNVDAHADISQGLGISSLPTFLAFRNGEKVNGVVGANTSALQELIQKYA